MSNSHKKRFLEKRLVLYAGHDDCLCWVLEAYLESRGYRLERCQDAIPIAKDCWHRVLVLDVDPTTRAGLNLLQSVKGGQMDVGVVVLTDNISLTNVAVARLNGAEALFFKPLADLDALLQVIEAAFDRLDRWLSVLQECAQRKHGRHPSKQLGPLELWPPSETSPTMSPLETLPTS